MIRITAITFALIASSLASTSQAQYATKQEVEEFKRRFEAFVAENRDYARANNNALRKQHEAIQFLANQQGVGGGSTPTTPPSAPGRVVNRPSAGSAPPSAHMASAAPGGASGSGGNPNPGPVPTNVSNLSVVDRQFFENEFKTAHNERQGILTEVKANRVAIDAIQQDMVTKRELRRILKRQLSNHLTKEEFAAAQEKLLDAFFLRLKRETDLLIPREPPRPSYDHVHIKKGDGEWLWDNK